MPSRAYEEMPITTGRDMSRRAQTANSGALEKRRRSHEVTTSSNLRASVRRSAGCVDDFRSKSDAEQRRRFELADRLRYFFGTVGS